jgi:ribonucleoside-diphosphate reductase alpha chain
MAIMFVESVYHPDIIKFIKAKTEEGVIHNANISVMVDDAFMEKVENDEEYQTFFDYDWGREYGETYKARDVFNMIVEGAWQNGEPEKNWVL